MISSKVFLGLDNGYSYVKTSEGVKIPSAIMETETVSGGTGNIVNINGKQYVIDKRGQYVTETSKTLNDLDKEITKVSTLAAIYLSFANSMTYKATEIFEVVLGVGLPISFFNSQKDEFVDFIKSLSGTKVSVDGGREVCIVFSAVYAHPQSAAIAFLNKDLFKEAVESIVLDLGWGTLDVTCFNGIKPVTGRYKTYALGLKKLYGDLATEISTKYNVEKDRYEIEDIIKENCVYVKGVRRDIEFLNNTITRAMNKIKEDVTNDFNKEINASRKIFLVGGGFDAFSENFKELKLGNVQLIENAQFANANAFKEVAVMKYKLDNK